MRRQRAFSRRDFLKLGGAGLVGASVLGAAGCGAGGGEARRLTYAYEQAEETSHGISARIFKERLEEESGGAIVLQVYPAGQLGGEPALLQKVLTQDIDFINSSTANASLLVPQAGVFSLHYLYDSIEHNLNVVADTADQRRLQGVDPGNGQRRSRFDPLLLTAAEHVFEGHRGHQRR